ncbi:hypothetical protein CGGC5_v008855 [Colletotrichum fructicola Nara gc5]|uniref:Uncharacterized protein n=1 Tax=Colletotrichum fructicola (strain Nara gc5) TaxID=1213859 RepID=A0A7J6J443_COLFN|nr:hypothetical protein CGGC5_v008855 [Colletotrichum fructicola Nara gc5]
MHDTPPKRQYFECREQYSCSVGRDENLAIFGRSTAPILGIELIVGGLTTSVGTITNKGKNMGINRSRLHL